MCVCVQATLLSGIVWPTAANEFKYGGSAGAAAGAGALIITIITNAISI